MELVDSPPPSPSARSWHPSSRPIAKIALVVRDLWEISDSISFDCLGQLRLLHDPSGVGPEIRVFCEAFHPERYGDVPTAPVSTLRTWLGEGEESCVVYHYCDGWSAFEETMAELPARVVVRWHNNTPPWFFARYAAQPALNTARGYQGILSIAANSDASIWTNSTYSAKQLQVLGIAADRLHVVYPVSSLLFEDGHRHERDRDRDRGSASDVIQVLFVGRVVPHKGYLHLVMTAATLKARYGRRVRLIMVGRHELGMAAYIEEIEVLARELGVDAHLAAEVSYSSLKDFYRASDVFLCLSEHEGFGLPVFEAMRFGLPVVGLRSTALGELLAHHPLAVPNMDYQAAAENILAAMDAALRTEVVRWQDDNLDSFYTAELVARQLASGLAGEYSNPPPPGMAAPDLAGAIERFRSSVAPAGPILSISLLRYPPVDAINRYVTRYDVEAFVALASAVPRKKRGLIERVRREIGRFAKRARQVVAAAGGAR